MFKESFNIETKEQRNYSGICAFRGKQEDNRKQKNYFIWSNEKNRLIFLEVIMKPIFKEKAKLSQEDEN